MFAGFSTNLPKPVFKFWEKPRDDKRHNKDVDEFC